MKKLSVVAVAVCLFAGASFAGWDKFGVIDDGAAEAKLGYYGGGWDLNIRYGLMEKLELYSTIGGVASGTSYYELEKDNFYLFGSLDGFDLSSAYLVGARYQIIPVLTGFLDLALPTADDEGNTAFGLRPGVTFHMNFGDKLSLGTVLQAGITLAPDSVTIKNPAYDESIAGSLKDLKLKNGGAVIDFKFGVELDYMFSDNIGAWVGFDFVYDDMTGSLPWHNAEEIKNMTSQDIERKFDAAAAITPGFGFFFTKDNLTVGTLLEFDLAHYDGLDDDKKAKKTVGLKGGVEFAVKF